MFTFLFKKFLTASLFLILAFSINAQPYLNETSKWYELSGDIFSNYYRATVLEIVGDTIITEKTYKKIQRTSSYLQLEFNSYFDTVEYDPEVISYEFIREEGKKFYRWFYEEDRLFADFDLEIGDEIFAGFQGNKPIISIDSILVGGQYRKIFNVQDIGKIYEGIGSEKGLFEGLGISGDEAFSILRCFSHDGETFKINGRTPPSPLEAIECGEAFLVNIEQIENEDDVKVYPTITKNFIFVELEQSGKSEIAILNSLGKEIKRFQFSNINRGNINVEDLSTGIYFLQIDVGEKVYIKKIFKR